MTVDIYSLGAILYELLTGRPPFRAATALETLEQVKSSEPVNPSRLHPGLPRDVEIDLPEMLAEKPCRRYPTGEALAEDLRRYLAGEPIHARPVPFWERAWKWARRRPTTAATLSLGAAAAVLARGRGCLLQRHGSAIPTPSSDRLSVKPRRPNRRHGAHAQTAVTQRNLAMKAFEKLIYEVQDKLGKGQQTRAMRESLLETAISGLGEIARDNESAASDLDHAVAQQKLADDLPADRPY